MLMMDKLNFTWRYLFLILAMIGISTISNATHIVGGDMTYRKIGPNLFEITLELRRDCNLGAPNAQFDDPASIGIFSSLGALQFGLGENGQLLIPYNDSDTLNNVIESDCGFEGTQVCVEEFKYVKELYLPRRSGGYVLAYQRCCRNGSLNNVDTPLETGATYWVVIPESAFDEDNDSPSFNQWPPVYICANEPINFDHSAMDTDGDSLVYSLCVPQHGGTLLNPMPQPPGPPPYLDIEWQDPYDLNNLLGGVPLEIDSRTGVITGTPNTVGQFLVGVCVEEYRNGVLIGKVNRDFQYNVRVCSDPPMADFDAPTTNCDGLTIPFTNTSSSATKYEWHFDYPNISPAFTSDEENPTFTFPTSGQYDVFLKVIRGTDQCDDSIVKTISVFDAEFMVDFVTTLNTCEDEDIVNYTFNDVSTIDVAGVVVDQWNWTIEQNGMVQMLSGNPLSVDLSPGDFKVTLDVGASNGCLGQLVKDILYDDFALIPDFEVSIGDCDDSLNMNVILNDLSQDLNPDYTIETIQWTVAQSGNEQNLSGDDVVVTLDRDDFEVTLYIVADNGCDSTITKDFVISDFLPSIDFDFELEGCFSDNKPVIKFIETSNDSVQYSKVVEFQWTINGMMYTGDSISHTFMRMDSMVTATLVGILDNGCTIQITKEFNLYDYVPTVAYTWNVFDCPTDDSVRLIIRFDSSGIYSYQYDSLRWMIGTTNDIKNYTGVEFEVVVPKDSIVHVNLSTVFNNGCSDDLMSSFYPGDFAQIEFKTDTLVLCPNEASDLVNDPNPSLTYTWSPTNGLDLSNPSNPIVIIIADQWYYVTVTDGLCSVEDSIFVDILESLELEITGDDFTCEGDVHLTASGGIGVGMYEWSISSDFIPVLHVGEELVTTFPGDSMTYYVRFVGAECTGLPTSITVYNQSIDLETFDPFAICPSDTVRYEILNNISEHQLEIMWDSDPHIISGENTLTPVVVVLDSDMDSFDLTYMVTNQYGCELKDTITFKIEENPEVEIDYEVVDCDTYEVCFDIIGDYNGFPVWDLGDPTTTDDEFLIQQVCYTYPGPGEYLVTLSNVSAVCAYDTVFQLIELRDDGPLFETDGIDACKDEEVIIVIPEEVKGNEFSWCDINGNLIHMEDSLKVSLMESTSYVLKMTDQNGCDFMDTIHVNIFDFEYDLDVPSVFCDGEEVQVFLNIGNEEAYSFEWSPEDCIVQGGNTSSPTIMVSDEKTLYVKITYDLLNCMMVDSIYIDPTELNIEVEAEPDAEIFLGESVKISVVDPQVGDTYIWSTGDTTSMIEVSPTETTTYTVTVTDEFGCMGEASVTITVIQPKCEEDVFLPNAFTPNGDEINSILYVRSNFVEDMLLIIYNRWNEEVFRSTDITQGWDGTYKGKELSPDSYAYYLRATCVDGFTVERSGSINLIR